MSSAATTSNIASFMRSPQSVVPNSRVNESGNSSKMGMVGCGVGALVEDSNSTMKHSFSESNLNKILK